MPVGTEASLASGTKLINKVAVHSPRGADAGRSGRHDHADHERRRVRRKADRRQRRQRRPGPRRSPTKSSATNHGPSLAREVKLVDQLPTGLTYKSSHAASATIARADRDLRSGQRRTQVTVRHSRSKSSSPLASRARSPTRSPPKARPPTPNRATTKPQRKSPSRPKRISRWKRPPRKPLSQARN